MDFRQNQIDFLKSYYNDNIVNAAVKYADDEMARGTALQLDNTWLDMIKKEAEKLGSEDIGFYVDYISKDKSNSLFDILTSSYVRGLVVGVNNPSMKITPDPVSEYTKNKDFAFFFDFGDNDFGGYVERAAQEFCKEYNQLLRNIDLYSNHDDCDMRMAKSYMKDLEFMENPENIINLMKSAFIGEYMTGMVDRCWLGSREDYADRLKDAERYIDYLGFDKPDSWKFGTWKEVNDEGLVKYRNMQSDEEYERANGDFTKYWLNGETLVVKMVNGELKVVK
jgi:hypothetical protein